MLKKFMAFCHRDIYDRLDEIVTFTLNLKALLVEVRGLIQLTRQEIMSEQPSNYSVPEPKPIANDSPSVHDLVIRDIEDRKQFGLQKYGTTLQPGNGRRSLVDAYQEVLDLAVYLRQHIEETHGSETD
jgi:hypothetical protein